jgi:uncharacterized glyoxalase superfamily protein PhnB
VDGVPVHVEGVDGHCERARAGEARVLREPTDEPYRRLYTAADLEGHRWMFLQPPPS